MKVRKLCDPCRTTVSRLSPLNPSGVPSARNDLFISVPGDESPGCIPSPLRGDSPDYRERYADNLSKELPRIPCVEKPSDFWAFSKACRDLAELHVGYEKVDMYPVTIDGPTRAQQAAPLRESSVRESSRGPDLRARQAALLRQYPVGINWYEAKQTMDYQCESESLKALISSSERPVTSAT